MTVKARLESLGEAPRTSRTGQSSLVFGEPYPWYPLGPAQGPSRGVSPAPGGPAS